MTHKDHVRLIKEAVSSGIWGDFGSGEGAFTLAISDAVHSNIEIYSVDRDIYSLRNQEEQFRLRYPDVTVHFLQKDFTQPISLPKLDGIIAANSVHYVKDKIPVLKLWNTYLKGNGKLIFVEYNSNEGNQWVPYPFSFESLKKLAEESGFEEPKLLETIPSGFMSEIYSAILTRK